MRAVAELVVGVGGAGVGDRGGDHARAPGRDEVGEIPGDARVDDRHANAVAGGAALLPGVRGADRVEQRLPQARDRVQG